MLTIEQMVQREVSHCVSTLVHTLSMGYGEPHALCEIVELTEQAFELSVPTEDYEEAARQEGWQLNDVGYWDKPGSDYGTDAIFATAEEACEFDGIDPYEWEIFEHWIVSDWLADKLRARGERVGELDGLTVWGRSTTGQAIYMDSVIQAIYREATTGVAD